MRLLAKDGLLDTVMIGHLYHPRFSDGDRLPASLSAKAIHALRADSWYQFRGRRGQRRHGDGRGARATIRSRIA